MSAPTPAQMAAWPAPNYSNPSTMTVPTISVTTLAAVTMLPCVISRLYFRMRLKGALGIDDYIIISAAVLSVTSAILAMYATRWGSGFHLWDIKPEWVATYKKIGDSGVVLFAVTVSLPKISVCFTYLDLFQSRRNTRFCWIMIAFLNCWWISTVLVTIFQCTPAASYWDPNILPTYCIKKALFNITSGVINTASDFLVYLWPIQFLWNIRLPTKQRIGVMCMFAIGCGACIAGIVRIYIIHIIFRGYDFFYYGAVLWIVSGVETNVGIIFSCMHAARPILSKLFPDFFGEVNRASSKNEKLKTIEISSNWSTSSRTSNPSNSSFTAGLDAGQTKSSLDWNSVLQKPMAVRSGTPRIADQFGLNMSGRPPARSMYSHSVKIDEWL